MNFAANNALPYLHHSLTHYHHSPSWKLTLLKEPTTFTPLKSSLGQAISVVGGDERDNKVETEGVKVGKSGFRWVDIRTDDLTETQKKAISRIPVKMSKRCKAVVKQIICFDDQESDLGCLLASWVKIMKPRRTDWLVVLKELTNLDHPFLFEIIETALHEESFEANVRDYTKLIDGYAKKGRLQDAENAFHNMKDRGFICDQVTLTALINMYSKNSDLKRAEETFEDMKVLGLPLDKRAYGSMIMAYVRAGMAERGESLLTEMEDQQIYAGPEVYKALLRAYSGLGNTKGAQRVFDAIQFAAITPDSKFCALLMNAYLVAGQSTGVRSVFDNMRNAGLEPSDKCMALILAAYEKENELKVALDLLMALERDGIMVAQEASDVLAKWFRRLGVVDKVELVLREYSTKEVSCRASA